MNKITLNYQFFLVKLPIIFPLFYGIILYNFPQFETELIIITIIGQMLYFYLDSKLWKFSDEHNRDNALLYLTMSIKE